MKISIIKEILELYDANKGGFRSVKDEPHIKELRAFYNPLSYQKDRELTSPELFKLVEISLGKTSTKGSASCEVFDKLFEHLGGRAQFIILQKSRIMNQFSVSNIVKMNGAPGLLELISLLSRINQLDDDVLEEVCQIEKHHIAALYQNLLILEKENAALLLTENIKGFFRFASNNTAQLNLGYFLSALAISKQLNQKQLMSLFDNFEQIKTGTTYKKILDYILAEGWNVMDYIELILTHGGHPEMEKAFDRMSEVSQKMDVQKEFLFVTILTNPQWSARIFDGVKMLSRANDGFFETVVSQPEYADKISHGIEFLSSAIPHSITAKNEFGFYVRKNAQHAETLVTMFQCLKANNLCNQKNVCSLLSSNLAVEMVSDILKNLSEALLLTGEAGQSNLDQILAVTNSEQLSHLSRACRNLGSYYQLKQKSYDQLFEQISSQSDSSEDESDESAEKSAGLGQYFSMAFFSAKKTDGFAQDYPFSSPGLN